MIKKLIKTVRGFSPVELVIMVGFGALAAAALIFLATSPQYMAQQPIKVNINVEGATGITSRQPTAKADFTNPDTDNIVSDGAGGWVIYPTGESAELYPHRAVPTFKLTRDARNIDWALNEGGGGSILLKAHKKGDSATFQAFEMGISKTGGYYKINMGNDCVIQGEQFSGEVYPAGHALAGKTRMTEFNNSTATFGVGMFYPRPENSVVVKNLVANKPQAFFIGSWTRGNYDLVIDNVNTIDIQPWGGFLQFGYLLHYAGGKTVVKNSTITSDKNVPTGLYTAGIAYIPFGGPYDEFEAEFTNNYFDLGSNVLGTVGIEVTSLGYNVPGAPNPKSSSVLVQNNTVANADIGINAGGFGSYAITGNDFTVRNVGLMAYTYTDEDIVVAKNNKFHIDSTGSLDTVHPRAGIYGYGLSTQEIIGLVAVPGSLNHSTIQNNKFSGTADIFAYMHDTFLGPNTANGNTFQGDNFSTLTLNGGSTYVFGPKTRNNVVVGHTGGEGPVVEGAEEYPSEPNTFTGPGFTGLDSSAAQALRDSLKVSNTVLQELNSTKTELQPLIDSLQAAGIL